MIFKLMNYFFPLPKTILELAKEKILEQNIVLSSENTDIMSGSIFTVGKLLPHKVGLKLDYLTVLFNYDNTTVLIKQNDVVLYYFNTKEEANIIRGTLAVANIKVGEYA